MQNSDWRPSALHGLIWSNYDLHDDVIGGQALAESQLPEEQDPVGTSEVSDEV